MGYSRRPCRRLNLRAGSAYHRLMDNFRKPIAVFCSVLFVVTAVAAILFFNFDRRAFTPETYQRAFAREDFYNKIPNLMAQAIVSSDADTSGLPLVMRGMSVEAWENFIRGLLPPDMLKTMGDDVLDSTFAYLNLESERVQVDLRPLKASMASDTGAQAALYLMSALPPCTVEQIARISFEILSNGQVELCNPPAEILPLITPVIQGQLQFAASIIPDELTLAAAPPQNDPRQGLQAIRFLMRLSPILPIAFLLVLTIAIVRSPKDWMNWWGIPILTVGFLAFIMGILGAPIVGAILEQILTKRLPNYLPAFLAGFTGDLSAAMVRALLLPVIWQGLLLLVIGAGMAFAAYYINRKEKSHSLF